MFFWEEQFPLTLVLDGRVLWETGVFFLCPPLLQLSVANHGSKNKELGKIA